MMSAMSNSTRFSSNNIAKYLIISAGRDAGIFFMHIVKIFAAMFCESYSADVRVWAFSAEKIGARENSIIISPAENMILVAFITSTSVKMIIMIVVGARAIFVRIVI